MSKSEAKESSIGEAEACESRFECPICLAWLRDPVLTSCGHRFCRTCIYSWVQKEGLCPVDNMKLKPEADLFPDNFTKREILQHKVPCVYNKSGCELMLSPLELEAHTVDCPYREKDPTLKKCLFHAAGCTTEFKSDEEFQSHISGNMLHHLTLLSNSYAELKSKYQIAHENASESKAEESFFWDPPTKESSTSQTGDSMHNLLRVLYEKIVLLEQKNREQDIIITNMSQQLTMQNSPLTEVALRYCNGCYLWTIPDFRSKLEEMYKNNKRMYYSPGFYTNAYGYRMCLRLNLSPHNPNHLALIIHVMKSDHDFTLDWPLNAHITIILIHPTIPAMHIRETMLTKPELEAFRRPTTNLNPRGFGYTEFALVQDLQSEGFLKNNELNIRIQVYTA